MPIGVCVIGEGNIKFILERYQSLHGVGRRAIHADFPIPIDRHEAEGRIDRSVHDCGVELVALDNWLPVVHCRTAERVNSDAYAGVADCVEIDDIAEVANI